MTASRKPVVEAHVGRAPVRREVLKAATLGVTAGAAAVALGAKAGSAAAGAGSKGEAKVIFVLYRKPGMTREECLAEWRGDQHVSIVRKISGLTKWVQNYVRSPAGDGVADGIGELYFENAETMERAMSSPEMAAAVEDAKRFLDMDKTYSVVVEETSVVT